MPEPSRDHAHHDQLLTQHLQRFFGDLEPEVLALLRAQLEWVEVVGAQVIGEMSLYADEPRSATVVAIRDSVLVRLHKAHFNQLLARSAAVSVALTRQIIQRLKTEHQPSQFAAPVTIGLIPVADDVDLHGFAGKLAVQLSRHARVRVSATGASSGVSSARP